MCDVKIAVALKYKRYLKAALLQCTTQLIQNAVLHLPYVLFHMMAEYLVLSPEQYFDEIMFLVCENIGVCEFLYKVQIYAIAQFAEEAGFSFSQHLRHKYVQWIRNAGRSPGYDDFSNDALLQYHYFHKNQYDAAQILARYCCEVSNMNTTTRSLKRKKSRHLLTVRRPYSSKPRTKVDLKLKTVT